MDRTTREIHDFLSTLHPYDALSPAERARVAAACQLAEFRTGDEIYAVGQTLPGLFLAGDYTASDYPATLESAVRSGQGAATAILAYGRLARENGSLSHGGGATPAGSVQ